MIGLDRQTLRPLGGDAHLAQSVSDILSTPKGTLVMQRAYGSGLPDLIDQPIIGATIVDLYQETAEALEAWEPRIALSRIELVASAAGRVELKLYGTDTEDRPLELDVAIGLTEEARAAAIRAGAAA